jgi:hypothetical protein
MAEAEAPPPAIVALSGLSAPANFDIIGDHATLAQRWTRWSNDFKLFCSASGITNPTQKRALLLHIGGRGIRDILKTYPEGTRGTDAEFDKTLTCLSNHFKEKKNVPKARQKFMSLSPQQGETVENYVLRLKTAADDCEFQDKDDQIRDKLINGLEDETLKAKLYRTEDLDLDKVLKAVSERHKSVTLKGPAEVTVNMTSQFKCYRCDGVGHYGKDCRRSRNHTCTKCNKMGHFEVCCKTKIQGDSGNRPTSSGHQSHQHQARGRGFQPRGDYPARGGSHTRGQRSRGGGRSRGRGRGSSSVHFVEEETASQEPDDEEAQQESFDAYCYNVNSKYRNDVELMLNGVSSQVIIDSGSDCSLMSVETFEKICKRKPVNVKPCTQNVYVYGSNVPMKTAGCCNIICRVEKTAMQKTVRFIIVPKDVPTLIGRQDSVELRILQLGVNLAYNVKATAQSTAPKNAFMSDLKSKYPSVFTGLGKLRNYQLRLHIDDSVPPFAQPVRRIPFSRREKVLEKLKMLKSQDVIEKVQTPTSWVSPLVSVEKPNGDVRICLDMRRANEAIIREKHPVPTVEETLQELSGAKYFAKLDMNLAFHQVELHPDSRDITTFAGPDGLYRYKRLIFGVNMATEKFQQIITQALAGLPGVHNLHDDIIISGATLEELHERVEKTVKRFSEQGLTLNYDKCVVGVEKLNFMGITLTSKGIKITDEKVKAITEAKRPETKSELRSWLGLAQFCAKFVRNFAAVTSPLWDLTKEKSEWNWTEDHEAGFNMVKRHLTTSPVMAYWDTDAETRITTDASPYGLGAILEQKQPDGTYRPVYYASRKLTDVESRYSQFEREALGVKWACQKFQLYLIGKRFEVRTDHKPLLKVLSARANPPSARIERWILYLQQFSFNVTHISGRENRADILSRAPEGEEDVEESAASNIFAYSMTQDARPDAITIEKIKLESARDKTITMLKEALTTGDWHKFQGTIYKGIKDELWNYEEILMRGKRVVMPESLWKDTLALAHEGHQGIVRTKARLRTKVWWPEIDKQVETLIHSCYPCQLVSPKPKPEPIKSTKLPERAWSEVAIDLLDIPGVGHLLVLIDYYSRWPEVVFMTKTDATKVIKVLEGIFQRHGLPDSLRSDNGPPFQSREFAAFLEHLGIDHKRGIPLSPESNGEVERFNRTLLKIARISQIESTEGKSAISDFLFQYRTTPHGTTGETPAKLLMGRELKTKMPRILFDHTASEQDWQIMMRDREALRKLKSKENADKTRKAEAKDIEEGDKVLLENKSPKNKLATNYEENPYTVIERKGNAVVIENENKGRKMRNTNQMKKFVTRDEERNERNEETEERNEDEENRNWRPEDTDSDLLARNEQVREEETSKENTPEQEKDPPDTVKTPMRSRRERKLPARFKDYELQ